MKFVFVLSVVMFLTGCECVSWFVPPMRPYLARIDGEAELAKATQNRQIKVQEAQAKMESAKLEAQAEIERAKGVAQANQIIGDSLKGNEDYLRYLWIHSLQEGKNEVIYVPTEAGLPILEANRFGQRAKDK